MPVSQKVTQKSTYEPFCENGSHTTDVNVRVHIGLCGVQIILALGNYMNSNKRGAAYGFKLQSLDMVSGQLVLLIIIIIIQKSYIAR